MQPRFPGVPTPGNDSPVRRNQSADGSRCHRSLLPPHRRLTAFINGVTKYVATSTHLDQDWANATALDGGLVEAVRDLKQQPGGDIGVHASISVAQALLAAELVDELRLVIAPRIAGRGRRLLDGLPPIQLASIRSQASPSGYLLADYRVRLEH